MAAKYFKIYKRYLGVQGYGQINNRARDGYAAMAPAGALYTPGLYPGINAIPKLGACWPVQTVEQGLWVVLPFVDDIEVHIFIVDTLTHESALGSQLEAAGFERLIDPFDKEVAFAVASHYGDETGQMKRFAQCDNELERIGSDNIDERVRDELGFQTIKLVAIAGHDDGWEGYFMCCHDGGARITGRTYRAINCIRYYCYYLLHIM